MVCIDDEMEIDKRFFRIFNDTFKNRNLIYLLSCYNAKKLMQSNIAFDCFVQLKFLPIAQTAKLYYNYF